MTSTFICVCPLHNCCQKFPYMFTVCVYYCIVQKLVAPEELCCLCSALNLAPFFPIIEKVKKTVNWRGGLSVSNLWTNKKKYKCMQLLFIFVDIALNSLASFDGPLIFINLHQIQLEQILIYFKIKSESTGDNIFKPS